MPGFREFQKHQVGKFNIPKKMGHGGKRKLALSYRVCCIYRRIFRNSNVNGEYLLNFLRVVGKWNCDWGALWWWRNAQIGGKPCENRNFGPLRKVVTEETNNQPWRTGMPLAWTSGEVREWKHLVILGKYRQSFMVSTQKDSIGIITTWGCMDLYFNVWRKRRRRCRISAASNLLCG